MATCFCGCERKVGAFDMQRKSANKVGRPVVAACEELERDVLPPLEDRFKKVQGDQNANADAVAMTDDLIAAGKQHEQACKSVVHEEASFAEVEWPEVRAWVRKSAQGMAAMFRLTPEQQQRIIDRS